MPERSVECSQCKKPVKVLYKEIVGNSMTVTEMCSDCPLLTKKLYGTTPAEDAPIQESDASLCCGHCHTSLEAIKMGNPIGCSQCYTIFADLLVVELVAENKLPKSMQNAKRNQPLHIGKTPDKPVNLIASNKLNALNEALNDALKKENYEEAAWLRDQIKELLNKKDEPQS